MNRIKKRHQQEVEADYPYSDKRVPHIVVRSLFGSCPVLVRSFIEQLSNKYGGKSLGKVIQCGDKCPYFIFERKAYRQIKSN